MFKNTQIKGKFAEVVAQLYLTMKGYRILSVNDRVGGIEGDIVAVKGQSLVLFEVKWRSSKASTHTAVHPKQSRRLVKKLQILSKNYANYTLQVDLVLICPTPPFIQHIKSPFSL